MNTIYCVADTGIITKVNNLDVNDAARYFNQDFSSKSLFRMVLTECGGLTPRRLNTEMILKIVAAAGNPAVHLSDPLDVDRYILANLDILWKKAADGKHQGIQLFFLNTIRIYGKLFLARKGYPCILVTEADSVPELVNTDNTKSFGSSFNAYYKNDFFNQKGNVRKLDHIIKREVNDYEGNSIGQ